MSHIFIERNQDGKYEVKEEGKAKPAAVADTQADAEKRAREIFPGSHPNVERVRNTESGSRDKWRKE
jgi:hypothetical protein